MTKKEMDAMPKGKMPMMENSSKDKEVKGKGKEGSKKEEGYDKKQMVLPVKKSKK